MRTDPELAEYLRTVLSRLGKAEKRKMFNVFCFYLEGKPVGFLVEDQVLVKTNAMMRSLWPDLKTTFLFEGATNPMWLIEDIDDEDTLCELYGRALRYLPARKTKAVKNTPPKKAIPQKEIDLKIPGSPLRDPSVMGDAVLSEEEMELIKASRGQ